jgi:integrase/recombinase XerD
MFLRSRNAQDLDGDQFDAWQKRFAHLSRTTRCQCAQEVYRLCRFRRRFEPDCFIPDPLLFPRRGPPVTPVILGPPDIARLIAAAGALPHQPQFPLRREALRLAVVLLYTTGMRLGEVARLTLSDVDLKARTLCVRASKFHKTRLVPLSPSATKVLRRYLLSRLASPWDISPDAALLGHHHGCERFRGYVTQCLGNAVRQLMTAANVRGAHGQRPRVHDLRHTFAVQALLRWYRKGDDVQAKLPQLSMYLGHVSICSTAYYLHFVPEVAAAAHRRFARYFGPLARGGVR